jgi:hypothetical protein
MKKTHISLYYKKLLTAVSILYVLIGLTLLGGCWQPPDITIGDSWDWDAGGGMVNVRIALNDGERFALSLDKPSTPEYVDYYEAVLQEQGTANYYIGTAVAGESYIRVSVPPGKTYNILVLAGTPANKQVSNGVKVLLASGWVPDYTVVYGQNRIAVPMKLHATEDCFVAPHTANGTPYIITYIPIISNMQGLLLAAGSKRDAQVFDGAEAYIIPYPQPYEDQQRHPAVGSITTNRIAGTLHFTITDTMPLKAPQEDMYYCYYNIGYYGFSNPASRSSRWDIRRGVTNTMYTEASVFGGGIPLRYDQEYYYVSSGGDDNNPGTKTLPFKTLAQGVKAVRTRTAETAPWIKTIVVLGTLNWTSESTQSDTAYKEGSSVFVIPNTQSGVREPDLIRITGDDPATAGVESAELVGASGRRVLLITGSKSKVQLAHIELYSGNADWGAGVWVENGAQLTITEGTVIRNNISNNQSGGGVGVENGTLRMTGGEIRNNQATFDGNNGAGGGVYLSGTGQSVFQMFGGTIHDNRAKRGGGVALASGTFRMFNGSIYNNSVVSGNTGYAGGVHVFGNSTFIMSGGTITGNVYNSGNNNGCGGGVTVGKTTEIPSGGEFRMSGTALINGNSSKTYGGGVAVVKGRFYLDTIEGAQILGNTANTNGTQVYNYEFFEWNGVSQSAGAFNNTIP